MRLNKFTQMLIVRYNTKYYKILQDTTRYIQISFNKVPKKISTAITHYILEFCCFLTSDAVSYCKKKKQTLESNDSPKLDITISKYK